MLLLLVSFLFLTTVVEKISRNILIKKILKAIHYRYDLCIWLTPNAVILGFDFENVDVELY